MGTGLKARRCAIRKADSISKLESGLVIIPTMKTQRERLLALIDRLPDDKLADVTYAVVQIGWASESKAELIRQAMDIREKMHQSLKNLPEVEGSRPELNGGESWTFNEKGEAINPFFTTRWYEDDGATHVQKQRWMFREQGFLTLLRTRMSADGKWYVLSLEVGGPGRIASHEERFPVSLRAKLSGGTYIGSVVRSYEVSAVQEMLMEVGQMEEVLAEASRH
jgi:hypothetical protein